MGIPGKAKLDKKKLEMAQKKAAKYREIYLKTAKDYVLGKISEDQFKKVCKKLEDVEAKLKAKDVNGVYLDLDFGDVIDYTAKRKAMFQKYLNESAVDNMSKSTWKLIKKEAGISKSGFLKKADANVGSNIDKYSKLHTHWRGTAIRTAGGDRVLLKKTIAQGEALKIALDKFVKAKEFKGELAQDLQKKCLGFISDLDKELKQMKELQGKVGDPTAVLQQLNQLGMGNFT